ncbi:MAG: hypothetical protein WCK90_02675 [archaeon]
MNIRRITSPEEAERKRKRNAQVIGVILGLILLISTAGYAFMSFEGGSSGGASTEGIRNNGNNWIATFQGQEFVLSNGPDNATEINMYATAMDYYGKPLYIVSGSPAITYEVSSVLSRIASRVQEACYENCSTVDLPEKNCTDNLIIWQEATVNSVNQKENCIFIKGDLRAVDSFLYRVLGY